MYQSQTTCNQNFVAYSRHCFFGYLGPQMLLSWHSLVSYAELVLALNILCRMDPKNPLMRHTSVHARGTLFHGLHDGRDGGQQSRHHLVAHVRRDTLALQRGTVGLQWELVDDHCKPRRVFERRCGHLGRASTCHVCNSL